ncbi:MspA family porin [Nocardia amikacinitolerans]|uniref:MspA family porin n=1 Tax=Nocardia amikacinitolerans TaxID=756689 RepID=UPI001C3FC827|nr:MspA family porin [Nocardia amikacinitolerans]
MGVDVQAQPRLPWVRFGPGGPAQDRPQPQHDLLQAERPDDIVVAGDQTDRGAGLDAVVHRSRIGLSIRDAHTPPALTRTVAHSNLPGSSGIHLSFIHLSSRWLLRDSARNITWAFRSRRTAATQRSTDQQKPCTRKTSMRTDNNRMAGYRRRIGLGLIATVIAVPTCAGTAHADTAIDLPGGERTVGPYFFNSFGEHAVISPALNANGTGRTAWVSGNATGTAPADVETELEIGYLVGCQVDLEGLKAELGATIDLDSPSVSAGLAVPLNAGEVKYAKVTDIDLVDGKASIRYRDQGIEITGCGGYAQARSVVSLTTDNGAHRYTGALYGQPFSIG